MPVISFYGLQQDHDRLGHWLLEQPELAAFVQSGDGMLVASRSAPWQVPINHRMIWCTGGAEPIQALASDWFLVDAPWTPFRGREIWPGASIFELRMLGEVRVGRLGLSAIQWRGGPKDALAQTRSQKPIERFSTALPSRETRFNDFRLRVRTLRCERGSPSKTPSAPAGP